jgi:putative ABC transport system permease protein
LVEVLLGALLLALVGAAYPLFLSRSEGELLASEIADPTVSRYGAGIFYGMTNVPFRERVSRQDRKFLVDRLDELFDGVVERGPHLGAPVAYALGAVAEATLPGGVRGESGFVEGQLVSATEAGDNVEIVAGDPSDEGAVLPDNIAGVLDVGPGDEIELAGRETIRLRVAALYRSLYAQPRLAFWLPWSEQIFRPCPDCSAPPQFILVGREELTELSRALGARDVDLGWSAPVTGLPLTLDEAREVRAYANDVMEEVTHRRTELGRVFQCCGQTFGGTFFFGRRDTEFRSAMPNVVREVERRSATVEGPLRLLLIAGLGVAAAVVAAAAAFAVAGRRQEAALLHARGWGPIRFSVRSVLESALPVVVGAAAGLGLGWWLVSVFGPAAPAAASARSTSVVGAAAAGAAALPIIGVVSAVSFIRTFEVHALKRRLAWVPWEVLAIAAAIWVLSRLRGGGALIEDPTLDIQRPSALLLAFPVLFVAGCATLGARLLVEGLRRAAPRSGASSPASYLAVHRMTGLPKLTVLLVGATALCLGVFVNGQTMVRSLRSTVDAKAGVFVGSDVHVVVDYDAPAQERFPFPLTRTTRLTFAGDLLPGGLPVDMLGIDPATFAEAAYWNPAFSDEPLDDLLRGLDTVDGPLRAILVQGDSLNPTAVAVTQFEGVPLEIVGRAGAFPGVSGDGPALVVDEAALEERLGGSGNPLRRPGASTEFWIAGDPEEVLDAVDQIEAFPLGTLTAEEVKDVPFIRAAIQTFSMLNILGVAAAALVVGVLVVYLQARQRARTVSNVLSLRMGMRDRQAMSALALELVAMLLAAFGLGAAFGLLAGRLVSPLLDPLQTIPPSPVFDAPFPVLGVTAIALGVIALVGGWLVHRRAAAVDLGEVLRVAE